MNLTKITLAGTFSNGNSQAIAWSGNVALKVDGINPVDVSAITLTIPTGTVTSITLAFQNPGTINGQLTGNLNVNGTATPTTVYTNGNFPYLSDTQSATGGATSYTSFTSPTITTPTDMSIDFGTQVVTPCSPAVTIADGQTPTLTLLFDLSRMLRFYDGNLSGNTSPTGVDPGDPTARAYFFAHTLFVGFMGPNSTPENVAPIAAFFGTPGSIQGYSSVFSPTGSGGTIPGWMTLVFDSSTPANILYGLLIPDDDNTQVSGKGTLGFNSPNASGLYNFDYSLGSSPFTLTGFQQQTVPGTTTGTTTYAANPYSSGYAVFTLQLNETQ